MRIGELAERAGVTAKTIRYYEDIGVLDEPERTVSGYRDYTDTAIDRLNFVRAGQAVGFTLGEIRSVLALRDRGEAPCDHVQDLLVARAAEIEQRIEELQALRRELGRLVIRAKKLDPAACDEQRICHLLGPGA
jgi:DNA-binding transcriptional MerR regulator